MEEPNPYTAPAAVELSSGGATDSWHLDGTGVTVGNGAILPAIELETGDEGPELVLSDRKFVKPHWSASLGAFVYPAVIILFPDLPRTWLGIPSWVAAMIIVFTLSIGVAIIARLTIRPIHFQLYRNAEAERRTKRKEFIRSVLTGLSSLIFLGAIVLLIAFDDLSWWFIVGIFIAAFLQLMGASVWKRFDRRRIEMTPAEDGRVRLTNVHRIAMKKLKEIKALQK